MWLHLYLVLLIHDTVCPVFDNNLEIKIRKVIYCTHFFEISATIFFQRGHWRFF